MDFRIKKTFGLLLWIFFTYSVSSIEISPRQQLESEIVEITERMYNSETVSPQDLAAIENIQARLSVIRSIERGYSTEDEIVMTQRTFDKLFLNDISALYIDSQFGPERDRGKILGYKLHRIGATHIFHILGFRPGDLLMSINDISLGDSEGSKRLLDKMKSSKNGTSQWQIRLAIHRQNRMTLKIIKILPRQRPN